MKKFILLILMAIFMNINMVNAKDIQPIKHNEFGETILAIDLDSVKPCSNGTYSVEVLMLASENWSFKDQILIVKYEIDTNHEQYRMIESFARYRKNWKISEIARSNSQLEERGQTKWQKVEKNSPSEFIYLTTSIIGLKGKQYYLDNF